ncbi:hypothetical protein PUS82_15055 [Cytobacillus firmus]|uniref:hypothetical protein n=1 Tax=Cytobacillus firmus TaxID=1399 RepID=UPI00237A8A86|nr:hypothetical protein [Cytobacillus firmus]MDD9312591.1 hypothetical protein [Cytobacillus firmus]
MMNISEHDKERLQHHQQNKQQQEQSEQQIQARQVIPKVETENKNLSSEDIRMINRMELLQKVKSQE